MRLIFALAPALLLAGCASDGVNSLAEEEDELRADCEARGGYLQPTGRTTGQPSTENVCVFSGATRLPTN